MDVSACGAVLCAVCSSGRMYWILLLLSLLAGVVVYDLVQRRHAILRNFPIIGHFRYLLEAVGPELRQYIVTSNNEERPFSRDQRRWVYASAKLENSYFGYGSDTNFDLSPQILLIKHATLVSDRSEVPRAWSDGRKLPCAKVLGAARGRARAFRPESVINISGMSYGSLSGRAVEALNRGAALAGCLHSTGEGGLAECHRHGGQLIFQIGTGYFGCRDRDGRFCLDTLERTLVDAPVRALELKLSQGAKPGLGGVLPAAKVTPAIARARSIALGQDCVSPSGHSAFRGVDEMLDFVERLADATGLPVGIKSAVGELGFWEELADRMVSGTRGVDFIQIDGGEGGTGAAPLVFTDHVSLPFRLGFSRVYRIFAERGISDRVVFVGSGKLGFPETGLLGLALGCDLVHVAREPMLAIGCIQAQRCHTGRCPTGVATQSRWLARGLDPLDKGARLANYVQMLRKELMRLAAACGEIHPALVPLERLELMRGEWESQPATRVFEYEKHWGLPHPEQAEALRQLAGC